MSSVMGSRQAAEFDHALERNGWNTQLVKELSKGDTLGKFLEVMYGCSEIKRKELMVDLDATPYVPDGYTIEEHQKGGQFKFNPAKVGLYYLDKKQGNKDRLISVEEMKKEFRNQQIFNACLCDFYLKYIPLIPKSWEGKDVCFWGTIYGGGLSSLFVRCLSKRDGEWKGLLHQLNPTTRFGYNPAVIKL